MMWLEYAKDKIAMSCDFCLSRIVPGLEVYYLLVGRMSNIANDVANGLAGYISKTILAYPDRQGTSSISVGFFNSNYFYF